MNNNMEKQIINQRNNETIKSSNFSILEKSLYSKNNNSLNFKYNSLNQSLNNDYTVNSLNYASNKNKNSNNALNIVNFNSKINPNSIVSDTRYNPKSTKNNGILFTILNLLYHTLIYLFLI